MPEVHDYTRFLESFTSPKFRALWPAQTQVLSAYDREYSSKADVAIELPTGSGKTLIALLIAEAWRGEGKKVAILSANKTLARQLQREAEELGIPQVLMEGRGTDILPSDKRAYQRTSKIGIMNYWFYFNQSPAIDPANLLIMDDAHLAEHCLHSLYSVEVTRSEHETLFKTLVEELTSRYPEYRVLADATANDNTSNTPPELLSFIDQMEVISRVREIIDASPYIEDSDLGYRWRRLRAQLNEANIYLGVNSIWIRPYIYPTIANQHYIQAEQRIYLSATIGDTGDLSRRLGVRPIAKVHVPTEYTDRTLGRRLVVMGREKEDSDLSISATLQQVILAALRKHPKSLWLCSSEAEARLLRGRVSAWLNSNGLIGHDSWLLTSLGDEIDQFKRSKHGHLFVAGRFDGMDFHGDECRLVVIPTLPRSINLQEEFISAYLRDAGFMKRRLNQRIVQALGRCNRDNDDFAVYVLADQRFATHFSLESNKVGLPASVVAEIDLAQDLAPLDEDTLSRRVQEFLDGRFGPYDAHLAGLVEEAPAGAIRTAAAGSPKEEVEGWTALFGSQNYELAADRFEECWQAAVSANLVEMGAFYGWQWAKALYLQASLNQPSAREKALQALDDAIKRGGQSAWFNRMRASLNRARNHAAQSLQVSSEAYAESVVRAFDDQLERVGTKGTQFEKWSAIITRQLQSERHDEFRQGLAELGRVLGYQVVLPRGQAATDCLWRGVFGNTREVTTFEAKIDHKTSAKIVASDVGQAHNQMQQALAEYGSKGYQVRSSIVTHLTDIAPEAQSSLGSVRIVEKDAILALWRHVRLLLSKYRDNWSLDNLEMRVTAAQTICSSLPQAGWFGRALDADQLYVGVDQLLTEWA